MATGFAEVVVLQGIWVVANQDNGVLCEGAVMWEDEQMTDRPTCRRCGHLRVCHRRGRCEYVQRSGWVPSHNAFTTEVPCECEGWQEPK